MVKDLATKKPRDHRVDSDSIMKKLPHDGRPCWRGAMRPAPARRRRAQWRRPRSAGRRGRRASRGGARPGGPGGLPVDRAAGGGGDIGQMLDRLPAIPLAELKAGDAIMVSTTDGQRSGPVTAIMLLAGVEPLLTASPNATRDIMCGWNLGGGGGGEGN